MLHARLRAAAGNQGWSPDQISTELWLDADDSGALTLDGNSNLTSWADKSGNSHAAAAPTSSAAPPLSTLNGKNTVAFNGVDHVLRNSSYSGGVGVTVCMVSKVVAYGAFLRHLAISDASECLTLANGNPDYIDSIALATTTYRSNVRKRITGSHQITVGYHQNVSDNPGTIWVDGEIPPTDGSDTTLAQGNVPSNAFSIGARWDQSFSNLHVGEIILATGFLSSGEIDIVEGYLAHKWGLTANLPAGHPYKSEAP